VSLEWSFLLSFLCNWWLWLTFWFFFGVFRGCDAESPCALAVPFAVVITLFSSSVVASLYGVLAY
jgi:hypothetical protein